jgi:hypothetical protein
MIATNFSPTTEEEDFHLAYRVSLKQALQMEDSKHEVIKAIKDEIRNMDKHKVLKAVKPNKLTNEERKNAVPSHMFLKFKYKADGSFDKVKARLVANGDRQHPDAIGETFSPTVNTISVATQLNIAAIKGLEVAAYDMKAAFLHTPVEEDRKIYIKVSKDVAKIYVSVFPDLATFLTPEGELLFQALMYMYGLAEAPRKFNRFIDKKMKKLGFKQTKADRCLYHKRTKRGHMMVSIHVDDMLVTAPTAKDMKEFERAMSQYFELVAQKDNNISYLGMNIEIDRKKKKIWLTQEGYIRNMLTKYDLEETRKPPVTPSTAQLMQDPKELANNSPVDKKEYLSLIMSLMYPARLTCPAILMPVTVLATRSADPMISDYAQAIRILRYLAKNPKQGPCFDGNQTIITPQIYADASHASHFTMHGQAGIIITLGSAPIYCRSYKLKSITRSSAESELYALEEASTYAVWLRLLLEELGVLNKTQPITIHQDNMSTIIMAHEGETNFKRTKHLMIRENYIKERIERGDIEIKHLPTEEMVADFLTKPLAKVKLKYFLDKLHIKGID